MKVVYHNSHIDVNSPMLKPIFNVNKPRFRSRFLVNKGSSYIILSVIDVAYFRVTGDILYAVCFDQKEYHIETNMRILEEELNPSVFFRVNRQFIVNVHSIHKIEPYFNGKIVVKTIPESNQKMVVSRLKAKSFKDWIDK
ncbi:LytTR family transcriptional regulator [Marinilabiliaceae bacterium JC017]|nr:LytTR family transcriptional regulator [Marinilabiliaceae bacterium JC017]